MVAESRGESIAIIGMGCRFPGAQNPRAFWQVLKDGVDAITEVPRSRWDVDEFYFSEPATQGKMSTRWGGFVEPMDQFDPGFFNISPREAEHMDPQQRLMLEVAWEALEDASIVPHSLAGSRTGVFVGVGSYDYHKILTREPENAGPYSGLGTSNCIVASRVAYALDLKGPNLSVDTGCSSSLVATHYACQSLQLGESDLCVVGGVNVILSPAISVAFSQARMMSSTGRCRAFDASADGYVRGEGCGVVVLKRLSNALEDGDRILAVIKGAAINQDGTTNGITAPNGLSQQALIKEAIANAGHQPAQLSYIEAHGTGTPLGDPIEFKALKAVMKDRPEDGTCWVGSVKTNVGHLEAAAGMAGLIKVVLSLHHDWIPPHLHLNELNPYISLKGTALDIPTSGQPWPDVADTRLAGVSGFSFGGTNCHLILEEPPLVNLERVEIAPGAQLLALSAKGEAALQTLAEHYIDYIGNHSSIHLAELCSATNHGRTHFENRLAIAAHTTDDVAKQLQSFVVDNAAAGIVSGQRKRKRGLSIAFLFTGQGSQYPQMGAELYQQEPVFRAAIDRCGEVLNPLLGVSLQELLYGETAREDDSPVNQTRYTQPCLFAVEYALAQLWFSWGIEPTVVMGHSVGEYVAATIAGVFSLEDGLRLIAERGRLMQSLPSGGGMLSVLSSEAALTPYLAHYNGEISIAAFNGPESTVLSGTLTAIESLAKKLTDNSIKTKKLTVSHGFHSPLMEPILADFREITETVEYGIPKIKLISNLTGDLANPSVITPDYWVDHIRQPVNFAGGMNTLAKIKLDAYVEVGTKPILLGMGRQCVDPPKILWLPSLRPGQGDRQQLLDSLSQLYVHGAQVNWQNISPKLPKIIPSLPTYPFQRQRYWVDLDSSHTSRGPAVISQQTTVHPLLGQAFQVAGHDTPYYETVISPASPAYFSDHCVFEQVIVPATAFLEMLLAAADQQFNQLPLCVESAQIKQGLLLTGPTTLQTTVHGQDDDSCTVEVYSRLAKGDWQGHIAAQVKRADNGSKSLNLAQYRAACGLEVTVSDHYACCGERGLQYGDCFQGITQLWQGDSQAIAQVQLPAALLADGTLADYLIHPALLDAAFQVLTHAIDGNDRRTYLPVGLERLTLYRRPMGTVWAVGEVAKGRRLRGTLTLTDSSGEVFARLEGLRVIPVTMKSLLRRLQPSGVDDKLYQLTWVEQGLRSQSLSPQQHPWLLFIDENTPADKQLSSALVQELTRAGQPPIRVFPGSKYAQLDEYGYQIRANDDDDLAQLLETIPPVQGMVYLWGTSDISQLWPTDQAQTCGTLLALVKALAHSRSSKASPLWVVTRGTQSIVRTVEVTQPQQASLWGLGRVITLEHPELQCRYIDLEADSDPETCSQLLIRDLLAGQSDDNLDLDLDSEEQQIAYRQQQRYVARLERHAITPLTASNGVVQLRLSDYGLIDNLHLAPLERRLPQAGEVEIAVEAVGLNFRDVLNSLGLLKEYYQDTFGIASADQLTFGFECAGCISAVGAGVTQWQVGDEVMATLLMDGFSSYIVVNAQQVMAKPSTMTSAEAATLPLSYLTAYYGLITLAQLKPGDKVLIHSAAGGVGQAAVQIAQHIGAEIYATASQGKWSALGEMGIEHVMDSRRLDFAEQILEQTDGQGVDVVLNSFNGDYILKTLDCLAANGRFVEIGKLGIWSAEAMAEARADVLYHPFDLGEVSTQEPETLSHLIQALSLDWESGNLKALPYQSFQRDDIQDAFRFMQQTRHVGKVVIQWQQPTVLPVKITAEGSYLITGGLGALGLEVAKGLVERGARHLALMGRRAPNAEAKTVIAALESQGVAVALVQADVSKADDIERTFQQVAQELPPLKGIVHCAGLLDDGLLYQMDWAQMERVMAPKVAGSWYLHQQSQGLDLDFFVCFSSMAALLGSPGQGNYAAANAFMDGLMDYRRGQGLPGQSIHWGPWGEVGMAAQLTAQQQQRLKAGGLTPLNPQVGICALFDLIQNRSANTAVLPIEWSTFLAQFPTVPTVFNPVAPKGQRSRQPVVEQQQQVSPVVQQLKTLAPGERRNFLNDLLRSQVAKVVGQADAKLIGVRQPLFDLGLDSLMAVELKSQLEANLQISVGNTLLFDYPTIEALVDYLLSDSQLAIHFEAESQGINAQTAAVSQKNSSPARTIDNAEAIAIVGMSCRFPGGVTSPEEFWQLLYQGVDGISEVPKSRWDIDAYYDAEPGTPGKIATRFGGFVANAEDFDAGFFGISPREAESLDPQQRLLLEVSWEALERAHQVPDELFNSLTGVFIGICSNDYTDRLAQVDSPQAYWGTGNALSVAAGRLSYVLGLTGPSLSVDTACSSSLVSVHLACQSLRQGECNLALAGGVNLLLSPGQSVVFSQAGMLSPEGRCKTFDAAANGYVRGEGCGVIVLKRLSDAQRDGDPILAVVRGSAVNQDGPSGGLTVPNGPSQQNVIRQALANGGVDPAEVSYVEAHGTGTSLGDPIEVAALGSVFKHHGQDNPLLIGSAKTNIGHLEGAAGVAGLMKVILQLHHRQIAPHLHFSEPNGYIDWEALPVRVSTQAMEWDPPQQNRIAGVSSFGFGGTNCHIVLQEAPGLAPAQMPVQQGGPHVLTLSAKSKVGLEAVAQQYNAYLQQSDLSLAALCGVVNCDRTHFTHRLAITTDTTEALSRALSCVCGNLRTDATDATDVTVTDGIITGQVTLDQTPTVAFLFTGQGSQYLHMGAELYAREPIFRDAIDRCGEILNQLLDTPLQSLIYPENNNNGHGAVLTDRLNQTQYTQPVLFAIEYALAQLWFSWGIQPTVVMGHSVGEYVAATIAGIFSLEDGLRLIAERGRLMQSLPSGGGMLSVLASQQTLKPYLEDMGSDAVTGPEDGVSIAALNGPKSVVLSGTLEPLARLENKLTKAGIKTKQLAVSHGFHSHLMDPILDDFRQLVSQTTRHKPGLKLISNLTGQVADDAITTADYWVNHIRQPVRFAEGMTTLETMAVDAYVEIGAKPILLGMGRQCVTGDEAAWLPSLRPGQDDKQQLLNSLAQLYVRGAKVNWQVVSPKTQDTLPPLPTYPFQRQRYWIDPASASWVGQKSAATDVIAPYPLLGQVFQVADQETPYYESVISSHTPAYLADHRVFEQVIFPATAFLEMVLEGGYHQLQQLPLRVESAHIKQGLMLSADGWSTMQTTLQSLEDGSYGVNIYSRAISPTGQTDWTAHLSAQVGLATEGQPAAVDIAKCRAACSTEVSVTEHYDQCNQRGLNYGVYFQGVTKLWQGYSQAIAQVQLPTSLVTDETFGQYLIHPALLDAALQVLTHAIDGDDNRTYLPIGLDRLTLYRRPNGTVWVLGQMVQHLRGNLTLMDSQGQVVALLEGLRVIPATPEGLKRQLQPSIPKAPLYQLNWVTQPLSAEQLSVEKTNQSSWLVFTHERASTLAASLTSAMAEAMAKRGQSMIRVTAGETYGELAPNHYQVRPNRFDDLMQLLQAIPAVQGVAFLWGLDTTDAPQPWQDRQGVSCGTLICLVRALVKSRLSDELPLWVITQGTQATTSAAEVRHPQQSSLWGLGRVIALEHPEFRCCYLDLDTTTDAATPAMVIHDLLASQQKNFAVGHEQIAYRQGQRYVARLYKAHGAVSKNNQALQLRLSDYGLIDNLHLAPLERRLPQAGEVEIAVEAVGLNFRDVLNSLGLLKEYYQDTFGIASADQLTFGFECAGCISAVGAGVTQWQVGDEVMATLLMDGFSSYIVVNAQQVMAKPSTMTSAEAATLPLSYLTAYYGLITLAQLKPGDKVLIHSAAGGVGQAAVQIAQHIGAEIYATASQGKWSALGEMGIEHVMDSRRLDFAEQILEQTDGHGVDVVLNSFNGDYILKTLDCLAANGRFVEIGKLGIWSAEAMAEARADVLYHPFDLGEVSTQEPETLSNLIQALSLDWESGNLKALPYQSFQRDDIQDAFRFMQQTRHVGKVVIQWQQPTVLPVKITAEGSYLITGGLGALGLEVAKGLVERGARHLALMGRRAPNAEAKTVIAALESQGVAVALVQADVSKADDIERTFQQVAQELPPLKGIAHCAGLLDDGLLYQMDWAQMERVMAPKVAGSWYLHEHSKALELDFFVCFSSMAALLGSPGQGNYAAANAFMDGLMDYRRGQGLPGQGIHWGPWAEVGMAAQLSFQQQQRLKESGITPLALNVGIQTLFDLIQNRHGNTAVLPIDWDTFLGQLPVRPPFLADIAPSQIVAPSQAATQLSPVLEQLVAVAVAERRNFLIELLRSQVAKVIGQSDTQNIGLRQPLFDLGLDSLMAVELKNQLESNLQILVGNTLLFDYPTIETLVDYLIADSDISRYFDGEQLASGSDEITATVVDIDNAEAIAIVGMSCRFPGGVTSPEEFWQLLYQGVDGISEVPKSRWDIDAYYDAEPGTPGKIATRFGGFVANAEDFDAGFFGISPREAESLDPQQRLLLEVSWEALERAHQVPDELFNSLTGVFIGICSNDYTDRLAQVDSPQAYWGTGNALSVAAGRLSYVLGLTGPSLSVDTACSSSLVSVHLACQSLRQGECNLALAGGVNLLLSPGQSVVFSQAGMLSPEGRCKTFDAAANGYVRGEGCGVIVLKRLSDAQRDGDPILAVVRGSAVNQDGPSGGLTVPNGPSQQNVIRQALANGGVDPAEVSYVEAHGTGTSLGDPIEVAALGSVFKHHGQDNPLLIGSAKTNIGHLEGAAGVAGLMKVILQLHHRQIAPHLHFSEPNGYIDWEALPVRVSTQAMEWDPPQQNRIAGVSSFGFGGTNCHIVLQEAPGLASAQMPVQQGGPHVLTLSAKSKIGLEAVAQQYNAYLQQSDLSLAALCGAVNCDRTHFTHRLAITTDTTEALSRALSRALSNLHTDATDATDVTDGTVTDGIMTGQVTLDQTPTVAFLFTGQGSQYLHMGAELYAREPIFRDAIDRCGETLNQLLDTPLQSLIYPENNNNGHGAVLTDRLNQTQYTQPVLFAIEYALAQLWFSWGIQPAVVMGHSVGEYVAATIAGVFSLEDGLRLIAERGRLMQSLPSGGGMLSVLASQQTLKPYLEDMGSDAVTGPEDGVSIAALNGPKSVVLSGTLEHLAKLENKLTKAGIKTKQLAVSHGFHSHLMDPILDDFRQLVSQTTRHKSGLKLISNLTGQVADDAITTADYWVNHIRQPVRFAEGMTTLETMAVDAYVEIGAKPILLGMARQCVTGDEAAWLPSLRPGQDDKQQLLNSLAQLYVRGAKVNWQVVSPKTQDTLPPLPTYPFQRQRYWIDPAPVSSVVVKQPSAKDHPLLGQRLRMAGQASRQYETQIKASSPDYLYDHQVFDQVIMPATGFIEIFLTVGAQKFKGAALQLQQMSVERGLLLNDNQWTTVQTLATKGETLNGQTLQQVELYSLANPDDHITEDDEPTWFRHSVAQVSPLTVAQQPVVDLATYQQQCSEKISVEKHYQLYSKRGLNYGDNFQGIAQLWRGENQVLAKLQLPTHLVTAADFTHYQIHPALLDAAFQTLMHVIDTNDQHTYLPISLEQLNFYQPPGGTVWVVGSVEQQGQGILGQLQLVDSQGRLCAELTGLRVIQTTAQALMRQLQPSVQDKFYQVSWHAQSLPDENINGNEHVNGAETSAENSSPWLLLVQPEMDRPGLAAAFAQAGQSCIWVMPGDTYRQLDENLYQVSPIAEDLVSLLQAVPKAKGIIYLWSLESGNAPSHTLESLDIAAWSQHRGCGPILSLVQALVTSGLEQRPPLYLATQGTQTVQSADEEISPLQAMIWGLGQVITLEHPEFSCRRIDLDPGLSLGIQPQVIVRELLQGQADNQVAYRKGERFVPRLLRQQQVNAHRQQQQVVVPTDVPFQLKLSDYGLIDNLLLQPMERRAPQSQQVEIEVVSVGLNFRDVLNALGLLQDYYREAFGIEQANQLTFGFECAGRIARVGNEVEQWQVGDEVIATLLLDSFSSYLTLDANQVMAKPTVMTFDQAATLPLSFLTAYYSLVELAKLQPGESILIHSAAGGVGQAAVQIAQAIGAEIYATASPGKWDTLKQMGIEHVMNSRTLDFADEILKATNGKGVSVVLNSFNGDFIDKSFEVLKQNGRFVEIGKLGIWSTEQAKQVRPHAAYLPFDLGEVANKNPNIIATMAQALDQQWEEGTLTALPHRVFAVEEIKDAFRFMQQAKHVGKVVVRWKPQPTTMALEPEATYLITGGLGALGLHTAQGLVDQGAKHLVLVGRREPSPQVQQTLDEFLLQGTRVYPVRGDVTQLADVQQIVNYIHQELPPLKGIIHAAGRLDDGLLHNLDWQRFESVLAPKVTGTWNLHQATQQQSLDFFICFSSVASLLGSPGQGNYAAANAFMDSLMQWRRRQGLPGVSINWGPWASGGMAAQLTDEQQTRIQLNGISPLTTQQGLMALSQVAMGAAAQVCVCDIDWPEFLAQFGRQPIPDFFDAFVGQQQQPDTLGPPPLLQQLAAAPIVERTELLTELLQGQVAKVLGLKDPLAIDVRQPLFDLGLDSLMAVELKTQLETNLDITVGTTLMFDYPSIEALVGYLTAEKRLPITFVEENPPPNAASDAVDVQAVEATFEESLGELSDLELAQLLAAELDLENAKP